MTGPEHYREAENFAELAARQDDDGRPDSETAVTLGFAQVHATLALAAATAPRPPSVDLRDEWIRAIYDPGDAS